MRWAKIQKAALWFLSVLTFEGMILGSDTFGLAVYAAQDSELEAVLESMEENEDTESIPDDVYDQDIDQFIQQYFEEMERSEVIPEGFEMSETIIPELEMEAGERGTIRYRLPNGEAFETTVPNGMITSEPVVIDPPDGILGTVQKDGGSSSVIRDWYFKDPGNYRIQMVFYKTDNMESSDYNVYEVTHSFTIIEKKTGKLGAVTAPEKFSIISVKRNGVPQQITHDQCVFLHEDGNYEIRYKDLTDGNIYITSAFELDTTAPFLTFSEEIADGPLVGPVEFYPSEVGNKVTVSYNGNTAETVTNVLKTAGRYILSVSDDAGNSRSYTVIIRQTFRLLDMRMVILAVIILILTGIRLFMLRRDMRVL